MYDKKIKEEFWTTFGKYMALHLSASGQKINWINYKTGVKHVHFKIMTDDTAVSLIIELSNPDTFLRTRVYQQLVNDHALLEEYTGSNWQWHIDAGVRGRATVSQLKQKLDGVNVFRRSDWPAMISFLKPLLLGVDRFWNEQRDLYEFLDS
jgi:uncharacterized protein DUF4268